MVIKLKNISLKRNDQPILNNINLTVEQGDFIFLIGENGSGKTTFAMILSGLIRNYEGKILMNNNLIEKNNETFFENSVGYIFQNPDNQFITTIVENDLAFGLEKDGYSYDISKSKIVHVLRKLDILDLMNRNISSLSGGEKQRVAIAAMLLLNKEIIIFDEPNSMLDSYNSKKLFNLILKLNREENKTIIFITHEQSLFFKGARILTIENGEIHEN